MNIELVDEKDKERWNAFVRQEGGTIFHLFEWPAILNATYGYKPAYFCARKGGEIEGIMPAVITKKPFGRRLISLPFADYAGPLAKNEDARRKLLNSALTFAQQKKLTLEIYSLSSYEDLKSHHFSDTFMLDTTRSFEEVWTKSFSKKVRNSVRKADKLGVVVRRENSWDSLKKYYSIYLETMHRIAAMPHHYSLFKNIRSFLGEKFQIWMAEYKGEPIAGLLTFTFNRRLHIWGNVSKEEYLYLAPNNALYCEAIKRACEEDVDQVDFGSTPLGTTHYRFKEPWGGTPIPIHILANRELSAREKKNRLVEILPVRVLGFTSKFVFKYLF